MGQREVAVMEENSEQESSSGCRFAGDPQVVFSGTQYSEAVSHSLC
jgi:hypothetical protein